MVALVGGASESSADNCNKNNSLKCNNNYICYWSTYETKTGTKFKDFNVEWTVGEAMRRELACGVKIANAYFDKCLSNPLTCNKQNLCIYSTDATNRWNKNSRWRSHTKEAKRRGLTCSVKTIVNTTPLRSAFVKLTKGKRKVIQSNLAEEEFYTSSIDGLYGRGTAAALKAYNKEYLGNADLGKSANVKKLIDTVLVLKPKTKSPATPVPQVEDTYKVASGTGFYVSNGGHIVTNHHVIDGCKDIKVQSKGEVLKTIKIADDRQNDLALLKASNRPSHVFPLSNNSPYPLQDIVVAGFPFGDRVSSSLKFTRGIVSSLSGIGNNYS